MTLVPVLARIAEVTRARVAEQKKNTPAESLRPKLRRGLPVLPLFTSSDIHVIAEIKRASPSEGDIAPTANPVEVGGEYLSAGAAMLSVLTEPHFFKGDVSFLSSLRQAFPQSRLLMKDFVMEEYQLLQAAAFGADAVLLIVALLDPETLSTLFAKATALGLTALVEVHDEAELRIALALKAPLIGVNNRNLKTMEVRLSTSGDLAQLCPKETILVSESGLKTADDIRGLQALGYRGFLIGTSFMKTGTPGKALKQLLSEVTHP